MTLISPYRPGGGIPKGPRYREGWDRPTGPAGWYLGSAHAAVRPLHPAHPLRPCRAPGPASLAGLAPRAKWLGSTPLVPHPVYPPVYPPLYPPGYTPYPPDQCTVWTLLVTLGTCTYDRFWRVLGEPRGIRTHTGSRVPGWFIDLMAVCTAV